MRPRQLPPPTPGTRGGTDGADPVREQQRAGPAASGRRRRLRARMAPADHHHVVARRRRRRPDLAARPAVPRAKIGRAHV